MLALEPYLQVIAATCLSANKFQRMFDYCIVDEASQIVEVHINHDMLTS